MTSFLLDNSIRFTPPGGNAANAECLAASFLSNRNIPDANFATTT
jgi:hypothetical protein